MKQTTTIKPIKKCAKCSERLNCGYEPESEDLCWRYSPSKYKKELIYGVCKTCGNIQKRCMDGTHSVQIKNYDTITEEEREEALSKLHHCDECSEFFKAHTKPIPPSQQKRNKRKSELNEAYYTINKYGESLSMRNNHNWNEVKGSIEKIEEAIAIVKRLSKYKND